MPRKAALKTDSKVRMEGCLGPAEFGTAYVQKWKQSREKGDPVSLLLLDLDGLHGLNGSARTPLRCAAYSPTGDHAPPHDRDRARRTPAR